MKFATKPMWHYPRDTTHLSLGMLLHYLRKLKIQIFCRCRRKCKHIAFLIASNFVIHPQILIFSVLKIASLSLHGLQIKLSMSLFFYLLPAALRAALTCRYLIYSEANFEVFRPAGATRCTDGGPPPRQISPRSPPPRQISTPLVQRQGCRTLKIEIFTQIWLKCGI